jgi:hypothetical protein
MALRDAGGKERGAAGAEIRLGRGRAPVPGVRTEHPEATGEPASYAIRRHALGGRKDILTLGTRDGTTPFLQNEVYRPGDELAAFREARLKSPRAPPRSRPAA